MLLLLAQSIIIICNDAQVYNPTASCFAQSKSHVTFDVNYVLYRKAEVYKRWIPGPWTPRPWTIPCGPPLIIENEFYWRSKRVLRTLNGRICVDKLYITIIRIKDPSYTLGPIFPELHESMNVIGWVSWSGERVTIFEGGGGEVGPKRCVTTGNAWWLCTLRQTIFPLIALRKN